MPRPEPREIPDEEELTQYGTTTEPFRNAPRAWESAVSLLAGSWHPLLASEWVRGSGMALADGTDAARYSTAGKLREKFIVIHSPTRRNPHHVSVTAKNGVWGPDECLQFDRCFGPVEVDETDYGIDEEEEADA